MASEIVARYPSGQNLYALLFNTVGQVYETVTPEFEAPGSAAWGDYGLPLTEASTTGFYRANMPAVPEGFYTAYIYLRSGDTPAPTDILVGVQEIPWSGAAIVVFNQTEKSGIAQLLARLGTFTGTGVNTVLGFLRAMSRKDVASPSDLGGTFSPGTDSLEGSVDTGASGATPAQIWAYTDRTLTQTAAQVAEVVRGSTIVIPRGDRVVIALRGLGSLSGHSQVWFTVKADPRREADAEATLQVAEVGGLLYLNGEPGSSGNASLVVDDVDAGNITVTLAATATQELAPTERLSYDVQALFASGPLTRTYGRCDVSADVTRAVS